MCIWMRKSVLSALELFYFCPAYKIQMHEDFFISFYLFIVFYNAKSFYEMDYFPAYLI